jgi:hypothetical protein
MSKICGWPPWLLTITSRRMPARATLSPISVHSRIRVSADNVSVPGNAWCSLDLPIGIIGRNVAGRSAGRRRSTSSTMPWLMQASTQTGRCGPCCSTAATGSTAIVRSVSSAAKSAVVISCHNLAGSFAMRPPARCPGRASDLRHGRCAANLYANAAARSGMTKIALGASSRNAWRVSDGEVDLVRRPSLPTVAEIAAEPQRICLDLRHTACIVIDMQNDFCAPGGWLTISARPDVASDSAVAADIAATASGAGAGDLAELGQPALSPQPQPVVAACLF